MSFEKFRILIWKNWTIKKRHFKSGIFELIFPVLLVILFTWVKKQYTYGSSDLSYISAYEQPLQPTNSCRIMNSYPTKIVMSPASPWLEQFVQSVLNGEEREKRLEFVAYDNAEALDFFLVNKLPEESVYGIGFEDSLVVRVLIDFIATRRFTARCSFAGFD